MELKLLHLSDIHFQYHQNLEHLDLDDDIRTELEIDLEQSVSEVGSINAILISGDIAYSGKSEEYAKAADWIKHICTLCGCEEENVLPVPGNHDIDRDVIGAMLSATHEKFIKLFERNQIDLELLKYLSKDEDLRSLLNPLENYFKFAQKYNALPPKNSFFWEKDLSIDNFKLRIRGMNSAIISNKNDDELKSKLILGSHQTTLKREKGIIYLTLCHHPTQWLYDGNEAEDDLNARAKVQLYGHKHIFKVTEIDNSLRLSAGALHPSRMETGWEPRYNIIGISIFENGQEKYLKVKIWERVWNSSKKKFLPKSSSSEKEFSEHDLKLNEQEGKALLSKEGIMEPKKPDKKKDDIEQINLNQPNPLRKLAYMFFDLPFHVRIRIASELELIEDLDENLSTIQQSQKYFKTAIELNLLNKLWEMVAIEKPEINEIINPFTTKEENL